jgi:hypothetical protein
MGKNKTNHQKFRNLKCTKLCKFFFGPGCTKGENCMFAHTEDDLQTTPDLYKTQICKDWKKGNCPLGDLCRHAHGFEELRRPTTSPDSDSNAESFDLPTTAGGTWSEHSWTDTSSNFGPSFDETIPNCELIMDSEECMIMSDHLQETPPADPEEHMPNYDYLQGEMVHENSSKATKINRRFRLGNRRVAATPNLLNQGKCANHDSPCVNHVELNIPVEEAACSYDEGQSHDMRKLSFQRFALGTRWTYAQGYPVLLIPWQGDTAAQTKPMESSNMQVPPIRAPSCMARENQLILEPILSSLHGLDSCQRQKVATQLLLAQPNHYDD